MIIFLFSSNLIWCYKVHLYQYLNSQTFKTFWLDHLSKLTWKLTIQEWTWKFQIHKCYRMYCRLRWTSLFMHIQYVECMYIREGEEAMESKIQEEGKMSFSPKTPDSEAITTMFWTILLYFLIYSYSPSNAIGQYEK